MSAIGRPATDLSGRVFGRLTAIARQGSDQHGKAMWRCRCTCGDTCRVRGTDLTGGMTKSCGCLRADESRQRIEAMNGRRAARSAA